MEVKKKISILIVEDEPYVSLSEKKILEKLGYRITGIAISASDAYASIASERPDLILMDVLITGDVDGIEAAEHINSAYNIPVVFITATEDRENIERIIHTGFYGFAGKPFREYELLIVIESALSRFSLERKIRLSEQKYRFIFENIQDVYFEASSDGIIEEISPSVLNLTGIAREWYINQPFARLITNSDAIPADWENGTIPANGIYHDISVAGPGGEMKICDIRVIRGLNASGKAVKLIGSINDISSRKTIEKKIISAKQEVESLLLSITSILIGVSRKDIVTHWNRTAETTFGKNGSEIIGKPITTANINWEWDRVFEAIARCIVDDRHILVKELRFTPEDQDATDKFLNIRITPVKSVDGMLAGFMIVGDDITETRAMRMRMNQSMKMEAIGQLAAGVAHEINTPMQYISDNSLFIRDSVDRIISLINIFMTHEGDTRECYERISRKAGEIDLPYIISEIPRAIEQTLNGIAHITKIVHSMKHFAHPGSQRKELSDVNRIIDDVVTISRNEWKYVAELETELMPDIPSIQCYPNELSQVLLNIIINAAQAIEEKNGGDGTDKGIIRIVTGVVKGDIRISISDTGTGIPEQVMQKIFDPFFTTKEVGRGTGQGLAISHSIIEDMHGGSISVKTTPGEGSSFIITLPVDKPQEEPDGEI